MKNKALLSVAATILMGCLLASAWGQLGEEDAESALASPFKGRVVIVTSKSDIKFGSTLVDPKIKKIGQVDYLVGVAAEPNDWTEGHTTWVAIDDICQLVEFEDIDEARKPEK